MNLARRLARLALQAAEDPDVEALKSRLLWNLTVAHGTQVEGKRLAAASARLGRDSPGSTALLLAADMHARTQDDFYPAGRVHIGATVIPAVLATRTDRVLGAVAAGYEVMALLSQTYSPVAQSRGFRPTGLFGPVGAAAAAGVALELPEDLLSDCLSIATVASAGTNQAWVDGTDEWLLELGMAARAGVEAAYLAAGGLHGAPRAFEGAAGWARAFFDDEDATALERSVEDYSSSTAASVALKRYPVSGIAQAPVAAAARARELISGQRPLGASIHMSPAECNYPGTDNRGPFASRSDALMSVPRSVTVAILHGTVSYRDVVRDLTPAEWALMDQVDLVPTEGQPESEVVVVIQTADGEVSVRLQATEILYPSWSELRSDTASVAQTCEANPEVASRLAELIDDEAPSDAFLEVWSTETTR